MEDNKEKRVNKKKEKKPAEKVMTKENELNMDKENGKVGNEMITRHEDGIKKTADEGKYEKKEVKSNKEEKDGIEVPNKSFSIYENFHIDECDLHDCLD